VNFISAASILDVVFALTVRHSEPYSKVGRATTLCNISLDLCKDYLKQEIHVIIQSKHFCLLDFALRTWKLKYIKQ